jgi:hypothetical protein
MAISFTCTISHGNQLRQATRLKHGGHHNHVTSGVDEVTQGLVVLEAEAGHIPIVRPCQLVKLSLEASGENTLGQLILMIGEQGKYIESMNTRDWRTECRGLLVSWPWS